MATKAELERQLEDASFREQSLNNQLAAAQNKLRKYEEMEEMGLHIWRAQTISDTHDPVDVTCISLDADNNEISIDLFDNGTEFTGLAIFDDTKLVTVGGVVPSDFIMSEIEHARKYG